MSKKILVVDDEPNFIELIKTRLEINNYLVVTASDGEEGISKAKTEKPDLILLDIMMPKADGYTTLKKLKNDDETKDIPVIILTCKEKMEDICKAEGAKGYITKPYDKNQLLDLIKSIIGQ